MRLKWYLIIIGLCALIYPLPVSFYSGETYLFSFGIMVLAIILVIIIDGVTAALLRLMPKALAGAYRKITPVSKKEKIFYEKILIKKWKDKIPEIGHLTGFRKNKVSDPKNPVYILRFIDESSYGEMGHIVSLGTGFLLLLFNWFPTIWFQIGLFVSIVNLILNVFPILVLRYNKYTLEIIYKRLTRK